MSEPGPAEEWILTISEALNATIRANRSKEEVLQALDAMDELVDLAIERVLGFRPPRILGVLVSDDLPNGIMTAEPHRGWGPFWENHDSLD